MDHTSISAVAAVLGVSWDTASTAVTEVDTAVLMNHPTRLDGVAVVGVDEHCWRHTRKGDEYATVIIDLTSIRDGTGPARLLDLVEGRSKQVFKTWLEERTEQFRAGVEIVAMDPFHVVALAGGRAEHHPATCPTRTHR